MLPAAAGTLPLAETDALPPVEGAVLPPSEADAAVCSPAFARFDSAAVSPALPFASVPSALPSTFATVAAPSSRCASRDWSGLIAESIRPEPTPSSALAAPMTMPSMIVQITTHAV